MNACPWCAPLGGALEEPVIFNALADHPTTRMVLGLAPSAPGVRWDPDLTAEIPVIRAEILDNG